jgi:FtsH-binding integral membrane protein
MKKFINIANRIVATFLTSALSIVGGSSVLNAFTDNDISVLQSACLAGFVACVQVVERLAKASLDGALTYTEINEAFLPTKKADDN